MLLFLAFAIAGVSAQSNCQTTATQALSDPTFAWLITGTSGQRASNVTAICASDNNPTRTGFNSQLTAIQSACVPGGAASDSTGLAMALQVMDSILCQQRDGYYCLLSFLPLFDETYMIQVASSLSFVNPNLNVVGDTPDLQAAMCKSDTCYYLIEQTAEEQLLALPVSSTTTSLIPNVRFAISRMRCGCWASNTPCQSTASQNALIQVDQSTGAKSFTAAACDANGQITNCARDFMVCNDMAAPACAKGACSSGNLATVTFVLSNLDWTCYSNLMSSVGAGAAINTIKKDVEANIRKLIDTDFSCTCGATAAPGTGTQCTCSVTCMEIATIAQVELGTSLAEIQKLATATVVASPNLDAALGFQCQVTSDQLGQGNHFAIASVQTNLPAQAAGGATGLVVGFSVMVSLVVSLLL